MYINHYAYNYKLNMDIILITFNNNLKKYKRMFFLDHKYLVFRLSCFVFNNIFI